MVATDDAGNRILKEPASTQKERITTIPYEGSKMTLFHASGVRPIIVHTTSLDDRCTSCTASNAAMLRAQHELGDKFEFVQLVYQAWEPGFKHPQFPSGAVHYRGSRIIELGTELGSNLLTDIPEKYAQRKAVIDRPLSDTPLPTVTGKEIESYVAKHSKDKLLVLHISSMDDTCPSCTISNKFVREAVRETGDGYSFAEMAYSPFSAAGRDEDLAKFLKKYGASIIALPTILIFDNGKLAANRNGLWVTVLKDLQTALQQAEKQ